jgi:hypothetical protein
MKERPILFNAEMVKAILSGRKTQTRRMVKFPLRDVNMGCELAGNELAGEVKAGDYSNCPLGKPGDQLWVRETWSDVNNAGCPSVAYRADGEVRDLGEEDGEEADPNLEKYWFATWYPDLINGTEGGWRPSIHMPRWASRINLLITGVRVERLDDISLHDARCEGIVGHHNVGQEKYLFSRLWRDIYGEESWSDNPWVWVIEFEHLRVGRKG